MLKETITIQISVYDWRIKGELIYEAQIRSLEDLVALSYQFGTKVKYKKKTDKNWYSYRAITKRLFNEEINENDVKVKLVDANDLKEFMEQRRHWKENLITLQKESSLINEIAEEKPDFDKRPPHSFGLELDLEEYLLTLEEHIKNKIEKEEKSYLHPHGFGIELNHEEYLSMSLISEFIKQENLYFDQRDLDRL